MNNLIVFLAILFAVICVILIFIILMQGGKSEGLFASAQANVLGGRGGDVLSRTTAVFAGIFIIGALVISFLISAQDTRPVSSMAIDEGDTNTEAVAPSVIEPTEDSTNAGDAEATPTDNATTAPVPTTN